MTHWGNTEVKTIKKIYQEGPKTNGPEAENGPIRGNVCYWIDRSMMIASLAWSEANPHRFV